MIFLYTHPQMIKFGDRFLREYGEEAISFDRLVPVLEIGDFFLSESSKLKRFCSIGLEKVKEKKRKK